MTISYSFKIKRWDIDNNIFNPCKNTPRVIAKTNNIFARKMLCGILTYPYLCCRIFGTDTEYDGKIFNCSVAHNPYLHFKYTQIKIQTGKEMIPLPKNNGYIVIDIDPRRLQRINIENKRRLKIFVGSAVVGFLFIRFLFNLFLFSNKYFI